MAKFLKRIILLALTVLLCTACSGGYSTHGAKFQYGGRFQYLDIPMSDYEDEALTVVQLPVSDIDSATSRIVYNATDIGYTGHTVDTQPFDTNEFYFAVNENAVGTYGVRFTGKLDSQGQKQIYCSLPDCLHNSSGCPAFTDLYGDYFSIGGQVYFYSPATFEDIAGNIKDAEKRIVIYKINPDGKTVLSHIPGYTGSKEGTVITDGKVLYLTAENESDHRIYIIKVYINTGQYKEICRLPKYIIYDYYKLLDITADGSQIVFAAKDVQSSPAYDRHDYVVGVCNLSDGAVNLVARFENKDFYNSDKGKYIADLAICNNYIYKIDGQTGRFTRQCIGENNVEILVDDIKQLACETSFIEFAPIYDDKVILMCHIEDGSVNGKRKNYIFNPETGDAVPMNITSHNGRGVNTAARILSATPDYFLISTATRSGNAFDRDMAIISRTDFYSNNLNLHPIGNLKKW